MLELARSVRKHLAGADLTRDADTNLSLGERADRARRAGADVFVSLHANEGPAGRRGAETFVHPQGSAHSRELAASIQRELAAFGGRGAGIEAAELAVLAPERHASRTAACLVEVDYLSDADGEHRLRDPQRVDALGRSIARGVRRYLDARPEAPGAHERYGTTSARAFDDDGSGATPASNQPNLTFIGSIDSFPADQSYGWMIMWSEINNGTADASAYSDSIELQKQQPDLSWSTISTSSLACSGLPFTPPNNTTTRTTTVRLPGPGTYRTIVHINEPRTVPESNMGDNVMPGQPIVQT